MKLTMFMVFALQLNVRSYNLVLERKFNMYKTIRYNS